MDFQTVREQFREYAFSFHEEDGRMLMPQQRKIDHTDEVCMIAKRLLEKTPGIGPDIARLTMFAALFHDVSRFEQYRDYRTFRDDLSFDHGDRSAEILKEKGFLSFLPEVELRIVLNAVRYHNKIEIPQNCPADTLLPAQIVRDADKLSILHLIIAVFSNPELLREPCVRLEMPITPGVTESVLQHALEGKRISKLELRCANDFIVSLFAWVNDLNTGEAARCALEERLYPQLVKFLPDTEGVRSLLQMTLRKLENRSRKP